MLVAIFGFSNFVYADDICTSADRNELFKQASNIVVTLDYRYNQLNEVEGFNYIIYNVSDELEVSYSKIFGDFVSFDTNSINYDYDSGIGVIKDDNLTDAYQVKFYVSDKSNKCLGILKILTINKPKYNEYSELEQCHYEGMEDFTYCQQWIESDFPYGRLIIIDRIDKQLESLKKKDSSICIDCDDDSDNDEIYENIVKLRKYAIIVLSIGIVINILIIIVHIKNIKESRI